ncbi:adenylosuccinate synthetase [Sorangium sp. So ce1036]|uniref:adenylosuccinate synthetase n=1 Tax=Sorangium sp. So ce1036 TaxID=3133328 RepID=UPI003F01AE06
MIGGKVNVLLDAQWGSSGKGKFSPWLAERYGVTFASSSNGPNAGHCVERDGVRRVLKCLPAACVVPSVKTVLLTGASVFDIRQFKAEACWTNAGIVVHERAVVLQERHREQERASAGLTVIASTQQGSAAAAVEKLMRNPEVVAAAHRDAFWPDRVASSFECRDILLDRLETGEATLHEVSQGYALSIDHGSHFPQCTSRNCTTARALDDLGISPRLLGDVYLNVRPYPIRVGHIVRDGHVLGHSGGFYPDCEETDWETVGRLAGMPDEEIRKLYQAELTTVTRRLRRVCTFSCMGFVDAVRANGATKIILNFAQYLDWSVSGARGEVPVDDLPARVRDFVRLLEFLSGCPVVAIGTGADHNDVLIPRRP